MKSNWTDVLIRRSCEDTETLTGRRPCDDGGRDNDAATSQGTPRIAGNHQKLREKHEQMLPQSFQREPALLTL